MLIKEVYARLGRVSYEAMLRRKRIIGAVIAVNGDCDKALSNLSLSPDMDYKIGTIRAYWNEFQKLSESEKKRFESTNAKNLTKEINAYANKKAIIKRVQEDIKFSNNPV